MLLVIIFFFYFFVYESWFNSTFLSWIRTEPLPLSEIAKRLLALMLKPLYNFTKLSKFNDLLSTDLNLIIKSLYS